MRLSGHQLAFKGDEDVFLLNGNADELKSLAAEIELGGERCRLGSATPLAEGWQIYLIKNSDFGGSRFLVLDEAPQNIAVWLLSPELVVRFCEQIRKVAEYSGPSHTYLDGNIGPTVMVSKGEYA